MPDIVHRIGIKAPITRVYAALATVDGVAGWWTRNTSGDARVGGAITFRFENAEGVELGRFDVNVTALDGDQLVRWHVVAGPDEWVGTDIEFALAEEGDFTIVRFGHRRWREEVEFMAHCSMKWATFLLSLRAYVESGTGRPSPDDLKIDNWN
ncbi:MAG TPA: SRPBCC domain-containing protein [Gemmatimonas sp.]|uniref:SRPBCC family protein n=1 Tax=Gemmatimonas sp. TaxID=1962908 RepID=UPI002ED852EC